MNLKSAVLCMKINLSYPWTVYCDGPPLIRSRNWAYNYNTIQYPALFEGRGAKNEALLFQSTVDIHFQFQNVHKTLFQFTVDIHFQNAHTTQKNCEGSHSVRLFWSDK